MQLHRLLALVLAVPLVACEIVDPTGIGSPDQPTNLAYQLVPSGDPNLPLGVILTWTPPRNGDALTYDVYGRGSTSSDWVRRATTTSPSFHDAGQPQLQYYVLAVDANGNEMGQSSIVTIDERNRLPAPQGVASISLDSAIQLSWSRNAVDAGPSIFDYYRVYSAVYDATSAQCSQWSLEGTTVSDAFVSAGLTNGLTRCFAVSAVSRDGHESAWSLTRMDTPRFDAHNVLVYSSAARAASAGFLFYDESAHLYGVTGSSSRIDLDFTVERNANDGSLWFRPARGGVQMMLYGNTPVKDLTSIDRAASTGFSNVMIEAVPGYAYLLRVPKSDGVHYGALRVAYVAADYVVFDWAYQSAVNNPELSRTPSDGMRAAP
jgi:hypothetical protein